jgi:hypothetical protein
VSVIAKIINDKYYTSSELAAYVVNKTKEIIGTENISEYIEPSADNGVFLNYLDKPYLAYDIEPEDHRIIKQDYLKLEIDYKKGRCIIGNPPYGRANTLSVQFYKKSIELGDFIVFILPISQLHNIQQMYDFDLIYSENLGKKLYSDREVHCCLNIYKRPSKGLNQKTNYKLKDVEILEYRRGKTKNLIKDGYDIGICTYGASIGKEITYEGQYAKEFYLYILNKNLKDKILNIIKFAKWKDLYPMTGSENINQWQIYKYIKDNIPEIN